VRRLVDSIYGAIPAEFTAPGSPEEAARTLAAATPRSALASLFTEAVVGPVTVDRVSLRRHRPAVNNSFAPYFRGRFTFASGRTVLAGSFGLHPAVKGFMTVWFGLVGVAFVAGLAMMAGGAIGAGASDASSRLTGLAVAGSAALFAALGLVFAQFGQGIARDDAERIRSHVETALSGGTRCG
jgi:hypothetical protein